MDQPVTTVVERRTTTGGVIIGGAVFVVSIAAFAILSIQSTADVRISTYHSLYTKYDWALALALALAGIALMIGTTTAQRPIAMLAAAGGTVFAAQLGGAGAVAHHHWRGWFGPGQPGYGHLDELKLLSLTLGFLGLLAVTGLVLFLVKHEASTTAVHPGARLGLVLIGLTTMIAVPWLLAIDDSTVTNKTYAGFAVLFSVAWGTAILAAGWLERWAAAGAIVAVLGSTLVAVATDQILSVGSPKLAFGTAAALTFIAAIARITGEPSGMSE